MRCIQRVYISLKISLFDILTIFGSLTERSHFRIFKSRGHLRITLFIDGRTAYRLPLIMILGRPRGLMVSVVDCGPTETQTELKISDIQDDFERVEAPPISWM